MKSHYVAALALSLLVVQAVAGNYILTIDGKAYDVELGPKQRDITLMDGRNLKIGLDKKAIGSFKSDSFIFDYPSRLSPSRTDLGGGIHQTIVTSPRGTLVIIQEYSEIDPTGLVDTMMTELNEEELGFGYKITIRPATKKLADGTTLTGKVAVSAFEETEYTRYVLTHKIGNHGVIVITQYEKENPPEELEMLDVFWRSLKLSAN